MAAAPLPCVVWEPRLCQWATRSRDRIAAVYLDVVIAFNGGIGTGWDVWPACCSGSSVPWDHGSGARDRERIRETAGPDRGVPAGSGWELPM